MKYLVCLIILIGFTNSKAVGTQDDVMAVVNTLFEGMRKGDSTLVRSVFTKDARLMTAFEKEGQPALRIGSIDGFVKAVGTPHEKVWNEAIWDSEVRIDGNLAQVWTKYAFYLGEDFSHCGVDAFQLFKDDNGWRIFQLTDTRQFEDCELPPEN